MAARIVLGARLRRMREAAGITFAEAGYHLRVSPSKIRRLEDGRGAVKQRDISDLLAFYGVHGGPAADPLALARQASAEPWWAGYGEVVPPWFKTYLGLEQAAAAIRSYEVQFIPGLLQTADYARAVTRLGQPGAPAEDIEQRVRLRLARQQMLAGPGPPTLSAVVDEAALRRPIGGHQVMRAQLRHLVQVSGSPGIAVQILPLRAGGHPAAGGSFTILRFAERDLPDVVYLEQLASALYLRKAADVGHYLQVADRLSAQAEPPARTRGLLRQIIRAMPGGP